MRPSIMPLKKIALQISVSFRWTARPALFRSTRFFGRIARRLLVLGTHTRPIKRKLSATNVSLLRCQTTHSGTFTPTCTRSAAISFRFGRAKNKLCAQHPPEWTSMWNLECSVRSMYGNRCADSGYNGVSCTCSTFSSEFFDFLFLCLSRWIFGQSFQFIRQIRVTENAR